MPLPEGGGKGKSEYSDIKAQWRQALAEEEKAKAEARRRGETVGGGGRGGAAAAAGLGAKMKTAQTEQERMVEESKKRDARRNKRKEGRFKGTHGLCMGLMGWLV